MVELNAERGGVDLWVVGRRSRLDPANVYAVVATLLFVVCSISFFLVPLPTMQWFSDYWEHAAAIKTLAQNLMHPLHPLYASHDPSRQLIPHNILLAMLVNYFGISVVNALSILATVVFGLLLVGVKLLADELFHHPWAPLVLLLTFLCAWGSPWVWTGFYEFRAIFYNSYYPSAAVLSLAFIAWWCALRYLRAEKIISMWAIGVMGLVALMYVTHQLAGLFAVGGLLLFAVFEPRTPFGKRLSLVVAVFFGILTTWFWPYFNPIGLAGAAAADKLAEDFSAFYRPIPVALLIGPAFLGFPMAIALIRRRRHLALVAGSFSIVVAYLLFGLIDHPVGHRLIAYFMVYLHLMLAWGILTYFSSIDFDAALPVRVVRKFVIALIAVFVLGQFAFAGVDFIRVGYEKIAKKSFGSFPNQPVIKYMEKIKAIVPDDAVVFSTPDESYPLPAFSGKLVDHPRAGWMIPDQKSRTKDNKEFFSATTTNTQRIVLIKKYGATFALLNVMSVDREVLVALGKMGREIPIDGNIMLIDFRAG